MSERNLILGRKPTFGDLDQIKFIQNHEAIVNGKKPIPTFSMDVDFDKKINPKIHFQFRCYKCQQKNVFEYVYYHHNPMESILNAEYEFNCYAKCKRCKHKYFYPLEQSETDRELFYKEPQI